MEFDFDDGKELKYGGRLLYTTDGLPVNDRGPGALLAHWFVQHQPAARKSALAAWRGGGNVETYTKMAAFMSHAVANKPGVIFSYDGYSQFKWHCGDERGTVFCYPCGDREYERLGDWLLTNQPRPALDVVKAWGTGEAALPHVRDYVASLYPQPSKNVEFYMSGRLLKWRLGIHEGVVFSAGNIDGDLAAMPYFYTGLARWLVDTQPPTSMAVVKSWGSMHAALDHVIAYRRAYEGAALPLPIWYMQEQWLCNDYGFTFSVSEGLPRDTVAAWFIDTQPATTDQQRREWHKASPSEARKQMQAFRDRTLARAALPKFAINTDHHRPFLSHGDKAMYDLEWIGSSEAHTVAQWYIDTQPLIIAPVLIEWAKAGHRTTFANMREVMQHATGEAPAFWVQPHYSGVGRVLMYKEHGLFSIDAVRTSDHLAASVRADVDRVVEWFITTQPQIDTIDTINRDTSSASYAQARMFWQENKIAHFRMSGYWIRNDFGPIFLTRYSTEYAQVAAWFVEHQPAVDSDTRLKWRSIASDDAYAAMSEYMQQAGVTIPAATPAPAPRVVWVMRGDHNEELRASLGDESYYFFDAWPLGHEHGRQSDRTIAAWFIQWQPQVDAATLEEWHDAMFAGARQAMREYIDANTTVYQGLDSQINTGYQAVVAPVEKEKVTEPQPARTTITITVDPANVAQVSRVYRALQDLYSTDYTIS